MAPPASHRKIAGYPGTGTLVLSPGSRYYYRTKYPGTPGYPGTRRRVPGWDSVIPQANLLCKFGVVFSAWYRDYTSYYLLPV
eukprot:599955-Rhodomonas_salina.4